MGKNYWVGGVVTESGDPVGRRRDATVAVVEGGGGGGGGGGGTVGRRNLENPWE